MPNELGVRLAPSGAQLTELKWIQNKAIKFAYHVGKSQLTRAEARQAYHSIYIPSLSYSLGTTSLSPTEAKSIQKRALLRILPALGINRHMPRAVVFGPKAHGGLGLRCFHTEQGIQQIELLIGHVRLQDTIGKLFLATLSMHQLTAGISQPILTAPFASLPYLDKGWFTCLRAFLSHVNGSIELPSVRPLSLARVNDCLLMDFFLRANLPTTTLQRVSTTAVSSSRSHRYLTFAMAPVTPSLTKPFSVPL